MQFFKPLFLFERPSRDNSSSYHIVVTNSRVKLQKPRRWKSMLIHQGWFTALYTLHLLDSQSFKFLICILQALNMPLIRCTNVFFQGRLSRHITSPTKKTVTSLGLGTTWVRQLRSGSCHHPTPDNSHR